MTTTAPPKDQRRRGQLTDRQCRGLRAGDAPLQDGGQLSLHPLASGKAWRFRYRLAGKEGIFTIGRYPDIGLAEARELRDQAAAGVRLGTAPIIARRIAQQDRILADARTLDHIVALWVRERIQRPQGVKGAWVPEHAEHVETLVRRFINAHPVAKLPIDKIEPLHIIGLLNAIPDYARNQVRIVLKKSFDLAIISRLCPMNPVDVVRDHVNPARRSTPYPAVREIADARAVLAAFDASAATPIVKLAHRFLALTALRINEAMSVRWDWIHDLDGASPTIEMPAATMKGRRHSHTVTLSPQAVRVLLFARRYRRHREDYVFLAPRGGGKASVAVRTIQIMLARVTPVAFVAHGWRSTFSTLMNLQYFAERAIIDMMLAHQPAGVSAVEAIYNREQHLERRRVIACAWADMLLEGAADLSAICGGGMGAVGLAA